MTQNPYQVLGVPNGADLAECTYKRLAVHLNPRLAKKYHPDLNPGDRVAEAKMAEVNAAFDAIKNGNTADSTSTGSQITPPTAPLPAVFDAAGAGNTGRQSRRRQRLHSAGDLYHPPGDFGNHLLGESTTLRSPGNMRRPINLLENAICYSNRAIPTVLVTVKV